MNANDPTLTGTGKPAEPASVPPAQVGSDTDAGSRDPARSHEETTDFAAAGAALPETSESGAAVTAFGRYQVRSVLGQGSFGIVYLGHDTQLDRAVAIKVLKARTGAASEAAQRFLAEARRVARLRHPGIVTVHDVGLHEGQAYIVSDYIQGTSLSSFLKANRVSWQEAARLTAALADALAHAHAQLTLHRDVKPGNIILTDERQPVLVDFGLGIDESDAEQGLDTISGTPSYMSPEQCAGKAHRIDGRTDIFSLGVLLYEMLCGRLPFRATERSALTRQICEDEAQPPRQLVRDIPRELERICLKALAKRIQDRYTTASDFADELRALLGTTVVAGFSLRLPESTVPPAEPTAAGQSAAEAPSAGSSSRSGHSSSSVRRAREAERRQVSALVCACGLFESEEFLQNVDADDQARVIREFQQACEQVVTRFDGTIVQYTEDGLIVCFGYPTAHEDAARRAARAGLGILRDIKAINQQLKRQFKMELNPWIGIHTGPAVVETTEAGITMMGEARNVAGRLKDIGEPGQAGRLVCSDATHRLIGGFFECESAGKQKIKGVTRSVEVFRVQGESQAQSPVDVQAPAGLTPLTGRDHEVSLLKDRWEQAQEGMGQVVLIIGEPGLGKSRLVYTIKQHVQETRQGDKETGRQGEEIVEWRCSPQYHNSVLYPAIDFFERFLGFGREEEPSERFRKLVAHLEQVGLAERDVVPLFAALLSLPLDDRFPPLNLTPVRLKEETLKILREWLLAYAGRRPVLFIIEDLHWIDPSTLEFLSRFVEEGLHACVMSLLTFRPEFKTPWPAVAHQTSLGLNRLTRRQVEELMQKKMGVEKIAKALVEQMYDRTGGVPLFVEEFTRMFQETEALASTAESKRQDLHAIPATLQDLVMDRLDRMASNREVVQLGATLGREFSYEVLAAVSPLDEPTLQGELAKLVQAELLFQKGRLPKCTFLFKHALLEDAAYNSMVKNRRQQFHQRIAEVLESKFPETAANKPELLARHFSEAGLTRQGIDYWLKAGQHARERSADLESIDHLTRGLEQVELLKPGPERDGLELQFQAPLGTGYLSTRGYAAPEVGPIFRRARELCEKVGQPPQLFAVMWGAWAWHVVRGDFRLCMDLGAEALELAGRLKDDGITMEALFMPGLTMLYRADFAGARTHCGQAVTQYDDRERTRIWSAHTGQNSGVTQRCYLALALWHLGYPEQALAMSRETVALARVVAHPYSLCYALHHTAWLLQHCRLGAEAIKAGEEEQKIGSEQGFTMWLVTGMLYRAGGLVLQGRAAEALPLLKEGLDAYRNAGAGLALPYYLSILGDAYTKLGKFEEALKALDEGLAIAEKNDDRFQEAELHRLKGELLHDEGESEACFRTAIDTARRQGSKAWALRSTMSLCRLWEMQGKRDEARQTLQEIFRRYHEGLETPDLVDARTLLETML